MKKHPKKTSAAATVTLLPRSGIVNFRGGADAVEGAAELQVKLAQKQKAWLG